MIENYEILSNGVIKQIKPFNELKKYTPEYISSSYNTYGEKGMQMAYLRLGYLLGVLPKPPISILDIGYGNGDFLKACNKSIPFCYGNDISGYPIPPNITFVDDIFKEHYDVICFFDVLEHFEDINFIKDLKCNYIYISVPCCHNISDEWFTNWKHRRPDEHLFHFNNTSIKSFFSEHYFECISSSYVEDSIRVPDNGLPNILTCIFKKK